MIWPIRNRPSRSASRTRTAAAPTAPAVAAFSLLRGRLWVVIVAAYLAGFGLTARLLVMTEDRGLLPWYAALLGAFFALYSLVWVRPALRPSLLHLIIAAETLLIFLVFLLEAERDFVPSLYALVTCQAALVFRGWVRWVWVGVPVALTAGSLMVTQGPVRGLGVGLSTVAIQIALPALAMGGHEIQMARAESRSMLSELEAANERLTKYASEVNDLAVVEERNRLARQLHDSVSQAMFGIVLATRSAQLMRKSDPQGVQEQLERLQGLTQDALARMRGFISELRPKAE